jgi:6,7-dimethyl-8-ribityllumazine synthase
MAGPSHYTLPLPTFDKPVKVLIVVAPYYRDIADMLIAGARATLERRRGARDDRGARRAGDPAAIGQAFRMANFDGFVALGCVIRGETTHYETVCNDSSRGLTLLGLQGACIGNGILTVENRAQAVVRADPGGQDKGGGAAAAALHLIALARRWGGRAAIVGFRPGEDENRVAGGRGGRARPHEPPDRRDARASCARRAASMPCRRCSRWRPPARRSRRSAASSRPPHRREAEERELARPTSTCSARLIDDAVNHRRGSTR